MKKFLTILIIILIIGFGGYLYFNGTIKEWFSKGLDDIKLEEEVIPPTITDKSEIEKAINDLVDKLINVEVSHSIIVSVKNKANYGTEYNFYGFDNVYYYDSWELNNEQSDIQFDTFYYGYKRSKSGIPSEAIDMEMKNKPLEKSYKELNSYINKNDIKIEYLNDNGIYKIKNSDIVLLETDGKSYFHLYCKNFDYYNYGNLTYNLNNQEDINKVLEYMNSREFKKLGITEDSEIPSSMDRDKMIQANRKKAEELFTTTDGTFNAKIELNTNEDLYKYGEYTYVSDMENVTTIRLVLNDNIDIILSSYMSFKTPLTPTDLDMTETEDGQRRYVVAYDRLELVDEEAGQLTNLYAEIVLDKDGNPMTSVYKGTAVGETEVLDDNKKVIGTASPATIEIQAL